MTAITITDLSNAKLDVDHIAAVANSTALTATDRLGAVKKTMAGASAEVTEKVAAVEAAKNTAINTSIPAAVALVDTAVAATAAGQAMAAKVATEAARDSINTTGKVFIAAELTSGAAIAGTINGQQFAVLAADLLSYGIYRNNAGTPLAIASRMGSPNPS